MAVHSFCPSRFCPWSLLSGPTVQGVTSECGAAGQTMEQSVLGDWRERGWKEPRCPAPEALGLGWRQRRQTSPLKRQTEGLEQGGEGHGGQQMRGGEEEVPQVDRKAGASGLGPAGGSIPMSWGPGQASPPDWETGWRGLPGYLATSPFTEHLLDACSCVRPCQRRTDT